VAAAAAAAAVVVVCGFLRAFALKWHAEQANSNVVTPIAGVGVTESKLIILLFLYIPIGLSIP
jgi:hypothetical protein